MDFFNNCHAKYTTLLKAIKMKYIYICLISILFYLTACSGGSSSSTETGYVDPYLTSEKTVALKSYTLGAQSCSSSKSCGAIIFQGTLNDSNYVGFAVDNYQSGGSKFSLKIYWPGDSIPSSIDNPAGYVIEAVIGGTTSSATGNLRATITSGTDSNGVAIYTITFTDSLTITFTDSLTIGSLNIVSGDKIEAYRY
jgi:hypothetical protein